VVNVWTERNSSFLVFGLSVVTIVFNDATDVYWARQQVTERLSAVKDQIPKVLAIHFLHQ
jgi:cobalt-zinc-cadmium resistance protein CzcA